MVADFELKEKVSIEVYRPLLLLLFFGGGLYEFFSYEKKSVVKIGGKNLITSIKSVHNLCGELWQSLTM